MGANIGQYANQVFKCVDKGEIISFEPLTSAFDKLGRYAAANAKWTIHNHAIGSKNEQAAINIASYDQSSSILELGDYHRAVDSPMHI